MREFHKYKCEGVKIEKKTPLHPDIIQQTAVFNVLTNTNSIFGKQKI